MRSHSWSLASVTRQSNGKSHRADFLFHYLTRNVHLSYDRALKTVKRQSDTIPLFLGRCTARYVSEHFDAALGDAKLVLSFTPKSRDALLGAAVSLYGLRRFKEALKYCETALHFDAGDKGALHMQGRCKDRLREEDGDYDFAAMLDEAIAKNPASSMDRADYMGSVIVRDCDVKSHGRGMFTTKEIKAGELLLVEKAFAVAFPEKKNSGGRSDPSEPKKDIMEQRAEMATSAFVKLQRNPSLTSGFAKLYPGPGVEEDIDRKTGLPEVTE